MHKINNLRGGGFVDLITALGIIGALIIAILNYEDRILAFQSNPNVIIPTHLKWLYLTQPAGRQFEYDKGAGPRSITI